MMKIEIPEQLWYIKRGDERLAYLTHYEDNPAFEKRKDTGLSWARGYRSNLKQNDPVIVKNELLTGYKIIDNVSRWSTSNVVWRVLDPRGFEIEIYSGNMMEIVKCATIQNGEIMTPCIFGRELGKNVLLPESSEPYKEAVIYTKAVQSAKTNKIKPKDLIPGDLCIMKNGRKYTFIGSYYPIRRNYVEHNTDNIIEVNVGDKLTYVFSEDGRDNIVFYSDKPNVMMVEHTTETFLNSNFIPKEGSSIQNSWGYKDTLAFTKDKDSVKIFFNLKDSNDTITTTDAYSTYESNKLGSLFVNGNIWVNSSKSFYDNFSINDNVITFKNHYSYRKYPGYSWSNEMQKVCNGCQPPKEIVSTQRLWISINGVEKPFSL